MAPIKTRTVGNFLCQFIGLERDLKDNQKAVLLFASEVYFSANQGGKIVPPDESSVFGVSWKSKMNFTQLEKYKEILVAGAIYSIKAAFDIYAIGTNTGVWYEILELNATLPDIPSASHASSTLEVPY